MVMSDLLVAICPTFSAPKPLIVQGIQRSFIQRQIPQHHRHAQIVNEKDMSFDREKLSG